MLAYVAAAPTAELFGRVHFDDGVFFSSAKALADSDGYVLANVPGSPAQTKYPVLYPWLLSLIWRWEPSFPANVSVAVWINALFACAFLVASFLYIRRQPGVGEWAALACVAMTASYTGVLDLSASLMSDVSFMALTMTALLLGELGDEQRRPAWSAAAGVAVGLAFLTRTAGIAFLAGIGLAALLRRDWRGAAAVTAGSAPFVFGHLLWSRAAQASADPGGASAGWVQLWTYMTSYPEFWKLSTPNLDIFFAMANANVTTLVTTPATMALFPLGVLGRTFIGFLLGIALSAAIVGGLVRLGRKTGWTAAHTALLITAAVSVTWNYPIVWRLLAVFLPLFCLGAWIEGRHIARMAYSTMRSHRPFADRAVSAVFLLGVVGVGAYAVWTHAHMPARLLASVNRTTQLFEEEEEVYRWIEANSAPSDVLLAYSDARFWLETGRKAVWPAAFTTEILYGGDAALEQQFDHYLDVARHLGARYWVFGKNEMAGDTEIGQRRLAEIQRDLPLAFETPKGTYRVFDLSSLAPAPPAISATREPLE